MVRFYKKKQVAGLETGTDNHVGPIVMEAVAGSAVFSCLCLLFMTIGKGIQH